MPISRTHRHHGRTCDSCGRPAVTASIFINGAGWYDFCTACDDDEEFTGPARAYLGPFPIRADAA